MLFEEFELRGMRMSNRICAAPVATRSGNIDGTPTERTLKAYERLASSAVSLINVEHHAVTRTGIIRADQLCADCDENAKKDAAIVSIIKKSGKIAIAQLSHGGAKIQGPDVFDVEGYRCLSPSGVKLGDVWKKINREPEIFTISEIKQLIEAFVTAASRMVKIAGYDGVMIHCAHGYLLGQFLSPLTNLREDAYGGTPYKRARLLYEIIDAVRQTLPDTIMSVRIGAADFLPDEEPRGLTVEDMCIVARELVSLGADLICISGNLCGYGIERSGGAYFAPYAAAIRDAIGAKVPVECTGGIRDAQAAEKIISNGSCDLIGLARPLIADPLFVDKWRSGIK